MVQKVFVTGETGCLGRTMNSLPLALGHEVTALNTSIVNQLKGYEILKPNRFANV